MLTEKDEGRKYFLEVRNVFFFFIKNLEWRV